MYIIDSSPSDVSLPFTRIARVDRDRDPPTRHELVIVIIDRGAVFRAEEEPDRRGVL